jgi:carbamoyl-phosphate synthase small subunit
VKRQILRCLKDAGVESLWVVPSHTSAEEIIKLSPEAVLLSNGPGDPASETAIVSEVQKLHGKLPLFGICLGHQILALSLGMNTEKLRFGHHAANHPVMNLRRGRAEVTSQNHGFAVTGSRSDVEVTHLNMNDQTIEGFRHSKLPIVGLQYHPEAGPGPLDAQSFFELKAGL